MVRIECDKESGRLFKILPEQTIGNSQLSPIFQKEPSICVERQIKFLRFTVSLEGGLKVRLRDPQGSSFDGPISSDWAENALIALQTEKLFKIETDYPTNNFNRLLNGYLPSEPTTMDLSVEDDDQMSDHLFADIKTEPVDSLFADWIEPAQLN